MNDVCKVRNESKDNILDHLMMTALLSKRSMNNPQMYSIFDCFMGHNYDNFMKKYHCWLDSVDLGEIEKEMTLKQLNLWSLKIFSFNNDDGSIEGTNTADTTIDYNYAVDYIF